MIADSDVKQQVRRYVGNRQVWTWFQNDAEQRLNAEFFKYKGYTWKHDSVLGLQNHWGQ